jgi:hypothetical protein
MSSSVRESAFGGRVLLFTCPGGVQSSWGVGLVALGLVGAAGAAGPGAVYVVPGARGAVEEPDTGVVEEPVAGELVVEPGPVVWVVPLKGPVVHGEGDTAGTGPDWLSMESPPEGHRARAQITATARAPPPNWRRCRRSLAASLGWFRDRMAYKNRRKGRKRRT